MSAEEELSHNVQVLQQLNVSTINLDILWKLKMFIPFTKQWLLRTMHWKVLQGPKKGSSMASSKELNETPLFYFFYFNWLICLTLSVIDFMWIVIVALGLQCFFKKKC